jgi:predicted RNA-binding Zn ribbon-like protein
VSSISKRFALLGEPLAVELVNTRPMRDGVRQELLVTDADAAAWLRVHSGTLPAGHDEEPPTAEQLRAIRGAVESLFDAALESRSPAPEVVAQVNRTSEASPVWLELEWLEGTPARAVAAGHGRRSPESSLAAIARSAIEILGDPRGARLRRCEAPDCVLLFVATNPRRRWCSTAACGNRVRVARHYDRTRRAHTT